VSELERDKYDKKENEEGRREFLSMAQNSVALI
jgi:hypothetical protein